jgi:hypothetical protein
MNRGRSIVIAIIAANLLAGIVSIVYLSRGVNAHQMLAHQLLRFVLAAVVFYYLLKGVPWARIVAVVLFTISSVTGVIGGFILLFMLVSESFVYFNLGISGLHLVSAAVLMFSPSVKEYFSSRSEC